MSPRERPVFFDAPDGVLFGVHAPASEPRRRVGIVLVQGGDTVNVSLLRNRLAVRLARSLAAEGYDVLRFDYHGLGESTGVITRLHLHDPFTDDVLAAVRWLDGVGVDGHVLLGACFGARSALSTAPLVPNLLGLVLATPPSAGYDRTEASAERMARDRSGREYLRRALRWRTVRALGDPALRGTYRRLAQSKLRAGLRRVTPSGARDPLAWVSPMLLRPLEDVARRRVPTVIAFGTADPLLREFRRAAAGTLGEVLADPDGRIEVDDDYEGVLHGFPSIAVQEAFHDRVVEWIRTLVPGGGLRLAGSAATAAGDHDAKEQQ